MKRCTLPELAEMAARARIEYTQHVCPVHRIHTLEDLKNVPINKKAGHANGLP
jgi:hypothetical protein